MNNSADPATERSVGAASICVEISDMQGHLRIDREALSRLAHDALVGEGIAHAAVSIALVDNAAIHDLNRRHLGHDWPTDVISFVLSDHDDPELAGELVVSTEMAIQTAHEAGADAQAELALYVVHGLLHLCGFDDTTEAGAAAMRKREGEVLAREGVVNTFSLVGSTEPANVVRERESAQ